MHTRLPISLLLSWQNEQVQQSVWELVKKYFVFLLPWNLKELLLCVKYLNSIVIIGFWYV